MATSPDIGSAVALPKVELHAHLTGSISKKCLHNIWYDRKIKEPAFEMEDPLTAIPSAAEGGIDVVSFFPIFDKYIYSLVSDTGSILYAVTSVLQSFADDGVRYLELRTTPRAIASANITQEDYVLAVLDAISAFTPSASNMVHENASTGFKLHTKLILSVDRRNTLEEADEVVSLALKHRDRGIVGVDLCGNPGRRPITHLAPAFARARTQKLPITLHFVEIAQDATEELETMLSWLPERLGHVIHVPKDLRERIRKRKLGLELCLSCNVLAGLSQGGFGAHHFGEWWRSGVPVALSTDDVGIFESPLSNEYVLAAQHFGLARDDLVRLSRGAVDTIFGGRTEKERMMTLLDEFEACVSPDSS